MAPQEDSLGISYNLRILVTKTSQFFIWLKYVKESRQFLRSLEKNSCNVNMCKASTLRGQWLRGHSGNGSTRSKSLEQNPYFYQGTLFLATIQKTPQNTFEELNSSKTRILRRSAPRNEFSCIYLFMPVYFKFLLKGFFVYE